MILVESPRSVTNGSKVAKKEMKEKADSNSNDDKTNKKTESKSDSKTQVAQASEPAAASEPPAEAVAAQNTTTQTPVVIETKLDINAIQPQVMQTVAETIATTQKETSAAPTATLTTSIAVSKGFQSSDGKTATLFIEGEKNIVKYTASLANNVTVTLNGDVYVLNFGEKSKVNIIQK